MDSEVLHEHMFRMLGLFNKPRLFLHNLIHDLLVVVPGGHIACPTCTNKYPLADFFNFTNTPSTFTQISAPYPPATFENWGINDGNVPSNPDNDADE